MGSCGPLFGKQPYSAPEPSLMQKTTHVTVHPLTHHTDDSFPTTRSAAMGRPQRLGWRSETARRYPTLIRVLHSASIRQRQQRCHGEYQPVPAHARGICPARLLPLPAHSLERSKACLYPEAATQDQFTPASSGARSVSTMSGSGLTAPPTALSACRAALCESG